MEEILQKLLEADILSEETKKELEEAVQVKLNAEVEAAKAAADAEVRVQLETQWMEDRDALIEAIDSKVNEFLNSEVEELREDIERFRDLEAEYAEKLVEAKGDMTEELKGDLAELVEKLDAFLEIRLTAEVEELREDIDEVRKNEFGRRIFEAFSSEFTLNHADEDGAESTLRETQEQLDETVEALKEAERKLADKERAETMASVLSPLTGRSREVMEAILNKVPTEQLEEGYKTFVGRVLKETVDTSEKEDKVLAEKEEAKESKPVKIRTGNDDTLEEEIKQDEESGKTRLSEDARERLLKLGGLI